jgi:hypothetical protein
VVNEALVKKLWPGLSVPEVIGKRIDAVSEKREVPMLRTIVGVVRDVHDAALDRAPRPEFYIPYEQTPPRMWGYMGRSLVVVARAANETADAQILAKPLRQVVARQDASLPLADSETMMSYLKGTVQTARMNTLLLSRAWRDRAGLGDGGHVRRCIVLRQPANTGDWDSLGARTTPALIWKYVMRRGLYAHRHRSCRRAASFIAHDVRRAGTIVRCQRTRSTHARRRRDVIAGRRTPGVLLCRRDVRHARSAGGALERRLIVVRGGPVFRQFNGVVFLSVRHWRLLDAPSNVGSSRVVLDCLGCALLSAQQRGAAPTPPRAPIPDPFRFQMMGPA